MTAARTWDDAPMCQMCENAIEEGEDYSLFGAPEGPVYTAHEGVCHAAFLYLLAAHDPTLLDIAMSKPGYE